jgi:transposase
MSTDVTLPSPDASLPEDAGTLRQLVEQLKASQAQLLAHEAQLNASLTSASQTIALQQQQMADQDVAIAKLNHELALLKRYLFQPRRERFLDDPRQKKLFEVSDEPADEVAAQDNEVTDDTQDEDAAKKPKRRGHGRQRLPQFLPRQRVEHTLPEAELGCPCCGQQRVKISEEVSEQVEFTPASLHVVEHVRFIYACKACQEAVVTADKPPQPIEKSVAGPGLLAQVITAKYADHLPLYRQEDILARYGVLIRRSTQCDWLRGAAECVAPLYQLLVRLVLRSEVLGTDDTSVKVLDPLLDHARTCRFWDYVGDARRPYTVYDFTTSRKRDGPATFLKDYQGVLQADAFGGYDGIYHGSNGKIREAGCNAHARRKFHDALETSPPQARQGLIFFQRLYDVEDEGRDFAPEARLALRQHKSLPIVTELKAWLNEQLLLVLPKTPVATAIRYTLRHWEALTRFTTDGAIPIDNNRTERELRAAAVGRKNWIFLGSDRGGQTAAILYSLVASAKRHRLDVHAYLSDVLTRLPRIGAECPRYRASVFSLRELLPDRWAKAHPQHVLAYRQAESVAAAKKRRERRALRRAKARR